MTQHNMIAMEIYDPDGPFLRIRGDDDEELVRIDRDLTITYGKSYDPDDAARRFWSAFAQHAQPPAKLDKNEALVKGLPMYINLAEVGSLRDWSSHIGWADVSRDSETGKNKIEITLDETASELLDNMVDTFKLKAIGFAGIKMCPEDKTKGS